MIKRLKKTSALIVLATTLATIVPVGNIQIRAKAADKYSNESLNNYNIESLENNISLASEETSEDKQIAEKITQYINGKYPGDTVKVQSPKYIKLTITKSIAEKMATQICSSNDTIRQILKNEPNLVKPGVSQDEVNKIVDSMTDEQIENVKPKVYNAVYQTILAFDGQSVPVYGYEVVSGDQIEDTGYFVGGKIGALIMQKEGKPLCVSTEFIKDLNNQITNKILGEIKQKISEIIQNSGITEIIDKVLKKVHSVVSDVTDTIEDLSDAIDDLTDSIKDKADDIDDAWDKVFDRFDNDEGWGKKDGYIYYYDKDGISLKGVQKIYGKTYYFNRIDGAMETGWQIVDGKRCYFDEKKGYQLFLQWVQDGEDWYFLSDQGPVKKSEWVNDNGRKYYLKSDGKMTKDWLKIDDNWYYFNGSTGVMEYSTWKYSSDKWYYLNQDGKAANDWTYINENWYYFRENSCSMETGWFRADGSWYYSDSTGAMKTGWVQGDDGWYYLDDISGKMKKNEWVYSNGSWYYFNINGAMVTKARYIDGVKYNFNSDGRMA